MARLGRAAAISVLWMALLPLGLARSAPSGWQPPQDVSGPVRTNGGAVLGLDGAGNAVVAWLSMNCGASSCDNAVQAARLPVGQTRWSPPATIARQGWYRPEIGRDIRGQALVVWQQGPEIRASSFAKGRWARSWMVTRLGDGRFPEPFKFVSNRSGNAALVWVNRQRLERTPFWVEASVRLRNGRWLPTKILSAEGAGSPSVAIDEAGTTIVVWQREGSRSNVIESVTRRASSRSWSRPRVLGYGLFPSVAVDGRGNFWTAWSGIRGVEVARRRARTTSWEQPRVIGATAPAYGPALAVGRGGTVALAWEQSGVMATRLRSPAASWEPARVVSRGFALNPAVAVDGRGTTFVIWEYFTGGTASTVEAVVRAPTASDWPPPVEIPQNAATRRIPSEVLVHGTNKALAAWTSASNVEIAAFNGR